MRDLLERFQRFSAYTLCWRIRRDEIGKFCFKIDKVRVKAVVFPVANDGRGLLVVEPVMLSNLFSQLLYALGGFLLLHGYPPRYERAKSQQLAEHL